MGGKALTSMKAHFAANKKYNKLFIAMEIELET